MRQVPGLVALGCIALLVQGTLGTFAAAWLFPDLAFLVAVGAGVSIAPGGALLVAAFLGYATDLLTGALLGQHALLLALAVAATRIANRALNLQRPLPRAALVAGLVLAYGLGTAGLTRLFAGAADLGPAFFRQLAFHACVSALCAPAAIAAVGRFAALLAGTDEVPRAALQVGSRARSV